MTSIRRYLNWALATLLLVVMSLAVTAAYFVTRHEMEEIFDAQLSLQGRIVAGLVTERSTADEYARIAAQLSQPGHFARWYGSTGNLLTDLAAPVLYDHEEKMISLGVWSDSGRPILMGARWHDDADGTSFPAPHHEGHRWVSYQDHRWRTFSMPIAGGRWLSIGLRDAFQSELFNKVALGNFVPLLLTLPILLWLMARLIRRGLAPIEELSRQVEARDEKDLRPIRVAVPQELQALRGALNDFIERLGQTLERERRFTADAAHELRTPLAALKIHLDNARFGEPSALDKAYNGIERLQRVVEQLLLLARLELDDQGAVAEKVELSSLVLDLAAELWPLAESQQQTLEITENPALSLEGNATELGILIRNLLDNALRYTPAGGESRWPWARPQSTGRGCRSATAAREFPRRCSRR
ncbi:histidine kinase dimerization/phospho-acceptor domain-containing protein [Salinicola tamaricis]|uniref:histidine kinase dimerization/phospho-acceptor domain-containing protein n=1 Tax=Salinicola tamaricis TaxID=1771309 RepID=UPI0030F40515